MTTLDKRLPLVRSTPDGASDPIGTLSVLDLFAWLPAIGAANAIGKGASLVGNLPPRYDSPGKQSVATNSVVTNDSPSFLSGVARSVGDAYQSIATTPEKVASRIGGTITGIFPWWFWTLIALALVAWIVSQLAPVLKRA